MITNFGFTFPELFNFPSFSPFRTRYRHRMQRNPFFNLDNLNIDDTKTYHDNHTYKSFKYITRDKNNNIKKYSEEHFKDSDGIEKGVIKKTINNKTIVKHIEGDKITTKLENVDSVDSFYNLWNNKKLSIKNNKPTKLQMLKNKLSNLKKAKKYQECITLKQEIIDEEEKCKEEERERKIEEQKEKEERERKRKIKEEKDKKLSILNNQLKKAEDLEDFELCLEINDKIKKISV